MKFTTLIEADELFSHLDDASWAIVDCRFSLQDTERGRRDYRQAHIPGAVYAHLDEDLSGPLIPGKTSRHPLPDVNTFSRTLSEWGISADTQVVVYDDLGGAIAARLWWMLRWLGHEAVAVLNGGWQAWLAAGLPTRSGVEARTPADFIPHPRPDLLVTADELLANLAQPTITLIDSRAPERYRGDIEPLDPVAGHIPSAINLPYAGNVDQDKRFLATEELRRRFEPVLGAQSSEQLVFYCGSGVTAAHNILAMAHAGLGIPRLYAGSWSEWITDPARPIEKG